MKRELRFETTDAFMRRARETARKADRGERIPASRVLSLAPEELSKVVTAARLKLVAAVRKGGHLSVTGLASRLGRDRAAVKRDIDILVQAGILQTTEAALPGHGRQVLVSPTAKRLQISADI